MPSLRTLDPKLRHHAEVFFRAAHRRFPGLVVTSARRTYAEQARLYRASLEGKNNGLPATPPGGTSHERGLAWDMARINLDPLTDGVLRQLGAEWRHLGGSWWEGDPVHFGWAESLRYGRLRRRRR